MLPIKKKQGELQRIKKSGGVGSAVTCHSGSPVKLVVAYTRVWLDKWHERGGTFLRKSFLKDFVLLSLLFII